MSDIDWREPIRKENPLCRKCKEDLTNIDINRINIGWVNLPNILQAQVYSEHKICKPIKKLWTKEKE
jgi:hypothetical protein